MVTPVEPDAALSPHILLTDGDLLPDLDDQDVVVIDWIDYGLAHDGEEIWIERWPLDVPERYREIFEILHDKYGERFAGLFPAEHTGRWLHGNDLNSWDVIQGLQRSVRKPNDVLIDALGAERAAPYLVEDLLRNVHLDYEPSLPSQPGWDGRVVHLRRGKIAMGDPDVESTDSHWIAGYNRADDFVIYSHTRTTWVDTALGANGTTHQRTVARGDLPALLEALGENADADILEIVPKQGSDPDEWHAFEVRLDESGVPVELEVWFEDAPHVGRRVDQRSRSSKVEADGEGGWVVTPAEVAWINLGESTSQWGEYAKIDSECGLEVDLNDCTDNMDDRSAWFWVDARRLHEHLLGGPLTCGWSERLLEELAGRVVPGTGHSAFAQVAQLIAPLGIITAVGGAPTDWLPGMPDLGRHPTYRPLINASTSPPGPPQRPGVTPPVTVDPPFDQPDVSSADPTLDDDAKPRHPWDPGWELPVVLMHEHLIMTPDPVVDTIYSHLVAGYNEAGDLIVFDRRETTWADESQGVTESVKRLTVCREDFPDLLEALGEDRGDDIIEVIERRWRGEASYDFIQILARCGVEVDQTVWFADLPVGESHAYQGSPVTTYEPDDDGRWTVFPVEIAEVDLGEPTDQWESAAAIDSEGDLEVFLLEVADHVDDRSTMFRADARRLHEHLMGDRPRLGWEERLLDELARRVAQDSGLRAFVHVAQLIAPLDIVTAVGSTPTDWLPDMPNLEVVGAETQVATRPSEPRKITMRDVDWDDLSSLLTATLNDEGALVISGYDIGPRVEATMGKDDYEYVLTYDKKVLPMLLEALGEDPDADILDVIEERWCGPERSFEFERLVREAGVPREVWNWY